MSFKTLKEKIKALLHLQDSTHSLAFSFAVGVFIAFCPLVGLHTVLAFFLIWLLRLNMLALFLGAFVNNPWTMFPIMGSSLWLGIVLYGGRDGIPSVDWSKMVFPHLDWAHLSFLGVWDWLGLSLKTLYEQIQPYFIPFFIGSTVLGIIFAILAYITAFYLIQQYRGRAGLTQKKRAQIPGEDG
jgi:uncharacterized protein (DUF2062 family)